MRTSALLPLGLLLALGTPLGAQPNDSAALETMRARDPQDAVVLYTLAAHVMRGGDRAQTLALLDAVARAPGGLDPSFYRGFSPLRGDSAFEQILRRIRSANPPIVRSVPAFTVAEPDLHPEGIAFDSVTRAAFLGSFKGKIVRVDSLGVARDFARVRADDGARVVVGLRVDAARRHLWAVVDDPRAFGDATIAGGALHQYDIASGALVAQFRGGGGAFNDVVVARDGTAYATNTTDGSIWRTVAGRAEMQRFLPPGSVVEANGIAISPDDRQLFIAGWHDIVRVDLRTRERRALAAPAGVVTGSFDGLYFFDGGLVGIQNGLHPGRVVRLTLDATRSRITKAEVLERYHPDFNGMTTGALDGRTLLYILNTQSRSFDGEGKRLPGVTLSDIRVVRLPLDVTTRR